MALQQSADLREVLLDYYQACADSDGRRMLDHMARDDGVLIIATGQNDWWGDSATIERIHAEHMSELRDAGIRFEGGDPQCYVDGAVGWCADTCYISLADGTRLPMRFTAVFQREGSAWKMVQSHSSFGTASPEATGTDTTT